MKKYSIQICELALARVTRLEDEERHLELCFKHLVCPKCGEDIEKKFDVDSKFIPPIYLYECKDCGWKEYRPI